eukprot:jgi/Mesvir1/2343/Mv03653-RA.1
MVDRDVLARIMRAVEEVERRKGLSVPPSLNSVYASEGGGWPGVTTDDGELVRMPSRLDLDYGTKLPPMMLPSDFERVMAPIYPGFRPVHGAGDSGGNERSDDAPKASVPAPAVSGPDPATEPTEEEKLAFINKEVGNIKPYLMEKVTGAKGTSDYDSVLDEAYKYAKFVEDHPDSREAMAEEMVDMIKEIKSIGKGLKSAAGWAWKGTGKLSGSLLDKVKEVAFNLFASSEPSASVAAPMDEATRESKVREIEVMNRELYNELMKKRAMFEEGVDVDALINDYYERAEDAFFFPDGLEAVSLQVKALGKLLASKVVDATKVSKRLSERFVDHASRFAKRMYSNVEEPTSDVEPLSAEEKRAVIDEMGLGERYEEEIRAGADSGKMLDVVYDLAVKMLNDEMGYLEIGENMDRYLRAAGRLARRGLVGAGRAAMAPVNMMMSGAEFLSHGASALVQRAWDAMMNPGSNVPAFHYGQSTIDALKDVPETRDVFDHLDSKHIAQAALDALKTQPFALDQTKDVDKIEEFALKLIQMSEEEDSSVDLDNLINAVNKVKDMARDSAKAEAAATGHDPLPRLSVEDAKKGVLDVLSRYDARLSANRQNFVEHGGKAVPAKVASWVRESVGSCASGVGKTLKRDEMARVVAAMYPDLPAEFLQKAAKPSLCLLLGDEIVGRTISGLCRQGLAGGPDTQRRLIEIVSTLTQQPAASLVALPRDALCSLAANASSTKQRAGAMHAAKLLDPLAGVDWSKVGAQASSALSAAARGGRAAFDASKHRAYRVALDSAHRMRSDRIASAMNPYTGVEKGKAPKVSRAMRRDGNPYVGYGNAGYLGSSRKSVTAPGAGVILVGAETDELLERNRKSRDTADDQENADSGDDAEKERVNQARYARSGRKHRAKSASAKKPSVRVAASKRKHRAKSAPSSGSSSRRCSHSLGANAVLCA